MLATHCPEGYPYARFRDLAPGMRIQAASAQILGYRYPCIQPDQVYTIRQADKDGIQFYITCKWGNHFLIPVNGIIPFCYGPLGQRPQRLVTSATVLAHAKRLLAKPENWVKGCPRNNNQYCAEIALSKAVDNTTPGMNLSVRTFFLEAIDQDNGYSSIANWNDAPERTHEEILAAFDRAIALATAYQNNPLGRD